MFPFFFLDLFRLRLIQNSTVLSVITDDCLLPAITDCFLSEFQNSCRLCRKIFCCEDCRELHEINDHDIHPKCDICINGKVVLRDPSDSLLEHIEKTHWPLHCVHCGRVFNTTEDIFLHNKCPVPSIEKDNENYNTPPAETKIPVNNNKTLTIRASITTSTPLAPREEEHQFLLKISEQITPVDVQERKEQTQNYPYKSALTPSNYSDRKNDQCSKRRVTFSEDIEEISEENAPGCETNSPNKTANSEYGDYATGIEMMMSRSLFSVDEVSQNGKNEAAVLQQSKSDANEDETLWESAINEFENEDIVTIEETAVKSNSASETETGGIWSSVGSIFKNVMQGLSSSQGRIHDLTTATDSGSVGIMSLKRRCTSPDYEDGAAKSPLMKKIKLTDIKCRRPIRYMKPALYVRYGKRRPTYEHKFTQTD